jgi:hypothetical protein
MHVMTKSQGNPTAQCFVEKRTANAALKYHKIDREVYYERSGGKSHFLLALLALEVDRLSLPGLLFLKLSRVLTRSRSKGLPS